MLRRMAIVLGVLLGADVPAPQAQAFMPGLEYIVPGLPSPTDAVKLIDALTRKESDTSFAMKLGTTVSQGKLLIARTKVAVCMERTSRNWRGLVDLMYSQALEGSRLQQAIADNKLRSELPFMAPEQTQPGAFVDRLADLYSLGAVVYTLLTGRPPFAADSHAELLAKVQEAIVVRPSKYQRRIPAPLEAAVLKLLARHQENRYQTATELLADLEPLAEEHDIQV